LYANYLPQDIFGNWIQAQMAFIDKMTITEFKGHVREEARHLNVCGLNQELGIDCNTDTISANITRSNRIFPPRRPNMNNASVPMCNHSGYRNHTE
jgi:hypothetical protein